MWIKDEWHMQCVNITEVVTIRMIVTIVNVRVLDLENT